MKLNKAARYAENYGLPMTSYADDEVFEGRKCMMKHLIYGSYDICPQLNVIKIRLFTDGGDSNGNLFYATIDCTLGV